MSIEREEGTAELRHSYPEHPLRRPLMRMAGALALTGLSLAAGIGIFRLGYRSFSFTEVVLPALGPTLLLLGASLLVSSLTGSYWAAAGATIGWWFLEIATRGQHTGWLYLFNETWPRQELDPTVNRWLLGGLGVALLAANGWWSARRPQRRVARR